MFSFFLQLAQDVNPLPTTKGLIGNDNLIWVIGLLLVFLTITNAFWIYRDRRLAKEIVDERKAWETKRDAFDEWKEKAHNRMRRLALRVQKALEVWAGIETTDLALEDEEDD